ncbi:cuticle protein 18.6-like [Ostrinia nubilalis]|uniref:cuticle protein 18.6-like n=1 Tax=Ostrinia nubilalis TaxID=29057 RepID=UPI0030824CD3
MVAKVLCFLALAAAASCQDYHHHDYHHQYKTVIQHEAPKKIEVHHPVHTISYKAVPVHTVHVTQQKHEAPNHYFVPAQPAPVHEILAPVHELHAPAPVYHAPVVHHAPAPVHHEEPKHKESHHEEDYYAHPKYTYEYKVEDPHTGDNKFQHETRDGDVVKGVYSLHDADGSIRTVEYSSDKKSGFNANVKTTTKHVLPQHHEYHH